MDSAADSLLALSNTAVALADTSDVEPDDDRSSSLSELDDDDDDGADEFEQEQEDADDHEEQEQEQVATDAVVADGDGDADADAEADDSEAETERLEISPDKPLRKRRLGTVATPSKLAKTIHAQERPEIESLTESAISSPISSHSELDELSDAPVHDDESAAEEESDTRSPAKRKRDEVEELDAEEVARTRRRRTGSVGSDDEDEDEDDGHGQHTRDGTAEPGDDPDKAQHVAAEEAVDHEGDRDEDGEDDDDEDKHTNANAPEGAQNSGRSRSSRRRDKSEPAEVVAAAAAAVVDGDGDGHGEDNAEAGEESDEAGDGEADVDADADVDAEVDDAEAAAKTEEEQANKVAAMESLQGLERHFAALRDRLYDERIAAINRELAQLAEPVPVHPELVKQVEIVKRWRDQKFEIEQKLLVYKIGALKNKSLAERSQIHSAYFQTVRDIREKHLERLSEHFYRIQRDRFKADSAMPMPSFSIPFPEKRSKQIAQQTAYNKEVSILSGVAKYVGFPAAPEIPTAHPAELEADLQKLGLSAQIRNSRAVARPPPTTTTVPAVTATVTATTTYSCGLGVPGQAAADEHFLERNPWANPPQHPIHRLAGLSRQHANQSPMNDSYLTTTPAQQRTIAEQQPNIGGSASTIPEFPSQPASSAHNTPHDQPGSHQKGEAHATINRLNSPSPLDTPRVPSADQHRNNNTNHIFHNQQQQQHNNHHFVDPLSQDQDSRRGGAGRGAGRGAGTELPSSPLAARVALAASSPPRPSHGGGIADGMATTTHSNPSPTQRPPGIAAGGYSGVTRLGIF